MVEEKEHAVAEETHETPDNATQEPVQPVLPDEALAKTDEEAQEDATPPEEEREAGKQAGSDNTRNSEEDEYTKHVQNWKALRDAREKAERERDEALKLLQQQGQNQHVKEEQFNISDDDLIEGKHLKYTQRKSEQKIADLEKRLIETQVKAAYPDFDEVVNSDTVRMLRDADPELAESLAANPNMHSQAVAVYKSIKRYGLARPQKYNKDKEKVNTNISKPRSAASLSPQQGESPLSRANAFATELTDDLKAQIWAEMKAAVKNG